LRLGPLKTDASVAAADMAPLVNILRAHRKRQLEERFAAGSLAMARTGLVFTTSHGGFIELRNANRMFHGVRTKADVPRQRPMEWCNSDR
jgi:hypothetical protein